MSSLTSLSIWLFAFCLQRSSSGPVTIGIVEFGPQSPKAYQVVGNGVLWKKYPDGSYGTCGNGAYGEFLLVSNRVDLSGHMLADVIHVDVEAEFSSCTNERGVDRPCYTNYFEVYVYDGSATLRFPRNNQAKIKQYFLGNFSSVFNITNTTLEGSNERQRQTFTFFRNGSNGVTFGIRSRGACGEIHSMKVYYYFCRETFINSVKFANTSSPVSGFREVNGSCSMNSLRSNVGGDVTGHCYSNGSWSINSTIKCSCIEGYEPSQKRGCSRCTDDSFKQNISNNKCSFCPSNSISLSNRTGCECKNGFYSLSRHLPSPSPCYAPLTLHQKPTAELINGGNVNITWIGPKTNGGLNGTIFYDVECYFCEAPNNLCNKKCIDVEYNPRSHNLTQTFVLLSNLLLNRKYVFRVYPKNSLNYMIEKQKWNYTEVKYQSIPTSTSTGKPDPHESDTEPTLYFIAGAVGLLVVILILSLLIFILKRRNTEKRALSGGFSNLDLSSLPGHRDYIDPTIYDKPEDAISEFTNELDPDRLFLERLIGGGEFGDVYKGKLKNADGKKIPVAVKTLKHDATPKSEKDFLIEASIMGQFNNPNVVRLEGVVSKSKPRMIVLEFISNGSLENFLKSNDGNLTPLQLIGMARGVAAGMEYLSGMKFVHRDLAARNILVNESLLCKISDFGLSRELETTDSSRGEYSTTGGKIPLRWTAPEAIRYRKFSSASDVWSYGILLWEIMSFAERPYWEWNNFEVMEQLDNGYRLPAPLKCPKGVHELMLHCWQTNRADRPTFLEITRMVDRWIRSPETMEECLDSKSALEKWLESIKMDTYCAQFTAAGYRSPSQIIDLKDEDLKEMGITLIGHRNKILKGVISLQNEGNERNSVDV